MLTELLSKLGVSWSGADNAPGRLLPMGWGMRGSLRGSAGNGERRVVTDYRAPAPISVGTLQAIETQYGASQLCQPNTRIGTITPYNGNRFMGYADAGQRMVGSSLLTSAAQPALNRRQGLPATGPIAGQPLSPMAALLLQSSTYDSTSTAILTASQA